VSISILKCMRDYGMVRNQMLLIRENISRFNHEGDY
jgi:hypothetical protein